MTQKEKAVELMKFLDIYEPYIKGFVEEDKVCWFDNYAGFWAEQDEELSKKVKEIEKKYGCLTYAITHEYNQDGDEMYSFLVVSKNDEEWDSLLEEVETKKALAHAYTWNKSCDWCSEFGDVLVQYLYGGLKRVA